MYQTLKRLARTIRLSFKRTGGRLRLYYEEDADPESCSSCGEVSVYPAVLRVTVNEATDHLGFGEYCSACAANDFDVTLALVSVRAGEPLQPGNFQGLPTLHGPAEK